MDGWVGQTDKERESIREYRQCTNCSLTFLVNQDVSEKSKFFNNKLPSIKVQISRLFNQLCDV